MNPLCNMKLKGKLKVSDQWFELVNAWLIKWNIWE